MSSVLLLIFSIGAIKFIYVSQHLQLTKVEQ